MTPITKETLEAAGFKANPDREEYHYMVGGGMGLSTSPIWFTGTQ